MNNYQIVLGPIVSGAAIHEDGSTVALDAAEAAPLMELGIIEQLSAKEAKPRKPAD